MAWYHKLNHPKEYLFSFTKWIVMGIFLGITGGLAGTLFHFVLHYVTEVRVAHPALLFLLPAAGLLIVAMYRFFGVEKTRGTNEIIDAFNEKRHVHPCLAPVIFLATTVTHLFGGSAGREGAALQIGGTLGSVTGRIFRLSKEDERILTVSGMSAVFAALFGTPLTAGLFSVEFVAVGNFFGPGFLPCFTAAFVASRVSLLLGVAPTTFDFDYVMPINGINVMRVIVLSVLLALVSMLFCYIMHNAEHLFAKFMPNPYVRIAVGGCILVVLTILARSWRYNGAGMNGVEDALLGKVFFYDFLLKIIFTAVTLGSGYKGGEIVPTFFVGATFGCLAAGFLGMDPGMGAMLGTVGLFCCVTNSPLTSIILGVEMFGSNNLLLVALTCAIGFVLSGNSGLYSSQTIIYSKTSTEIVNRRAK